MVGNPGEIQQVRDAGEKDCQRGNPVIPSTGNKIESELDFESTGEMPLYLRRTYNHYWNYIGLFGRHWVSNFDYSLVRHHPILMYAQRPDGRRIRFVKISGQERWNEAKAESIAYIVKNGDGTYTHFTEDNTIERYSGFGYILEVKNRQGIGWTFAYDANNYLQRVTHTSGRFVEFVWAGGQLTQVKDPAGNIYNYAYTTNAFGSGVHRLATATLPGPPATMVTYHYERAAMPGALTGKSYDGVRHSTFDYDSAARAKLSEHAGGVERHSFTYTGSATPPTDPPPSPPPPGGICNPMTGICVHPDGPVEPGQEEQVAERAAIAAAADSVLAEVLVNTSAVETNPLSKQTTYQFQDGKLTSVTGHASTYCAARYAERSYDANGYEDVLEDFNGHLVNHDYNAKGRRSRRVEAQGTSQARTTTYTWDDANNRITLEAIAGHRDITYTYTPDHRLASVTVTNRSGHGVAGQAHTTTYAYTKHPNGLLATVVVDGPLAGAGDAVIYAYSAQGDLTSVRNSLGHTISYSNHNGLGQPGRVVGANGEATEYSYDARGRTTKVRSFRNAGQQDTIYTYSAAGLLASIATPDGVTESYSYDAARRLTQISRNEPGGTARRVLAYDNASNLTRQDIYRGTVRHYQAWTDYDELNRVRARRGNNGQHVRYEYDGNDNLVKIIDALGSETRFDYDALDRVSAQTDAAGGVTRFAYDAGDRPRQVTDPRNRVTAYQHDGFGQLWQQTSPDTGTTTFQWNANGQRTSTSRGGITTTYAYTDALGRPTAISASGQTHAFVYDACDNGKGRLCKLTDPHQTLTLGYAPYGELTMQAPTISGATGYTHTFGYDAIGRLIKIGYPNGVEAQYQYTLDRVTAMTVKIGAATRTVVNGLAYEPMGPIKQFDYGNGYRRQHAYDLDYRLTGIGTDNLQGFGYTYDPVDRITGLINYANGHWSQNFNYDALSRLTGATSAGLGNQGFDYDAGSNRTRHTRSGQASPYTISTTSNQLTGIGGGAPRSYTYTATGNVATVTGATGGDIIFSNGFQRSMPPVTTYGYDPFDRLSGVSGPGINASYKIAADGRRVQKTANGETMRFVYGPGSQLLSEHRTSPNRWTHHLWLNGQPVGFVRGTALYFVHPDHLGRPEVVTDAAQAHVWRANLTAFDRRVINDRIGGYALGFPGQYHDAETGLWYNLHRTYDPHIGRYLESDPIGLAGGINTYAYALNSPIRVTDALGLCGMGAALGSLQNGSSNDFTGVIMQAQTIQLQQQAEQHAGEQIREGVQEAGECAADVVVDEVKQQLMIQGGALAAQDLAGMRSSRHALTIATWSAIYRQSPIGRVLGFGDSVYELGACVYTGFLGD